jgi:hypothetical protein
MNIQLISAVVLSSLILAVLVGRWLRRILPNHHLNSDTKDTVKLAMGLVGTMAALLLGLLISSAKGSYDADKTEVIQMAAKISFLNRVLDLYGPEAADARAQFRLAVKDAIANMWPADRHERAELTPNREVGDSVYFAIAALPAKNELQQKLKTIAETAATDLAQQRCLLLAQAQSSISVVMLVIVVCWLVVIFVSFSLIAPSNSTATIALLLSTVAVSGAIFLMLELDQPFDGIIRIPSRQIQQAFNSLAEVSFDRRDKVRCQTPGVKMSLWSHGRPIRVRARVFPKICFSYEKNRTPSHYLRGSRLSFSRAGFAREIRNYSE